MNDPENIARYCAEQTQALLYNLQPDVIARRKAKQHAIENCPYVEFEQDMGQKIPFCKMTGELCDCQCNREKRLNVVDDNQERKHEFGGIDYKKAFEFLMVAMIAKTLSPDGDNFGYGSPDMCIKCMSNGHNFAYGDDGDKKLVCDTCPYNCTNVFGTKDSQ